MKKLLLAGVSLVALNACGSALAADMPLKAPPPPLVYSWTGCYGGGFVGYGWGNSQHRSLDPRKIPDFQFQFHETIGPPSRVGDIRRRRGQPMSALSHWRTSAARVAMSALTPKADIAGRDRDACLFATTGLMQHKHPG